MVNPEQLLFAKTHEWVHLDASSGDKIATIGISAHAVEALTDLVYIELPPVGTQVTAGQAFGEIESVKAVSDLYSPVSGEVVAVNQELAGHLEILNEDPYTAGWMIRVKLGDEAVLADLFNFQTYQKHAAEDGH